MKPAKRSLKGKKCQIRLGKTRNFLTPIPVSFSARKSWSMATFTALRPTFFIAKISKGLEKAKHLW